MNIRYVVGTVFALIFGYFLFSSPDAIFRSSDGQWADSEVQFKGRDFRTVVVYFEAYKIMCNAPKAVLLRATPQEWFNFFAWPSYLRNKKWRVPFSDKHPELGDYFEPPCEQGGDAAWTQAEQSADRYLNQL
jgi:hypothetical protein